MNDSEVAGLINDPLALLERSLASLAQLSDPEVRNWLRNGLKAALAGDDPLLAMGLRACDRRRCRLARRNYWIFQALRHIDASNSWRRCVELESEIRRFESVIWPRYCEQDHPPLGSSELRTALFRARREHRLPTTAKSISYIMEKCSSLDFTSPILDLPSDQKPNGGGEGWR